MKNHIYKQLKELLESGQLAEFYDEDDDEKCNVGRVADFDEKYLLLQSIGKHGDNDGLILISIEKLTAIVAGGSYVDKVQTLNEWRKGTAFPTIEKRGNLMISVLESSRINGDVMSVATKSTSDFELSGIVTDVDKENNVVTVSSIDNYGDDGGVQMFDMADILAIVYEDVDCCDKKYLYTLKHGQ